MYKIFTYENYIEFLNAISSFSSYSLLYILLVVILFPLNIYLEAQKWRKLVSPICLLSISTSIKSVLVGGVGALLTPNRLGDFPLRAIYMPNNTKVAATAIGFMGSLFQNLIIAIFGVSSLFILLKNAYLSIEKYATYIKYVLFIIAVIIFTCIVLPNLAKKILSRFKVALYLENIFRSFSMINFKTFIIVFALTFLRYLVFSFQFYFALTAFGVSLTIFEAILSISTMYLLITITPSIVATDLLVRTSFSLMMIGLFTDNLLAISLATTFVWLVNSLFPTILGSLLLTPSLGKS